MAIPGGLGIAVVALLLAFGQRGTRALAADSVTETGVLSRIAAWRTFSLEHCGESYATFPSFNPKITAAVT